MTRISLSRFYAGLLSTLDVNKIRLLGKVQRMMTIAPPTPKKQILAKDKDRYSRWMDDARKALREGSQEADSDSLEDDVQAFIDNYASSHESQDPTFDQILQHALSTRLPNIHPAVRADQSDEIRVRIEKWLLENELIEEAISYVFGTYTETHNGRTPTLMYVYEALLELANRPG